MPRMTPIGAFVLHKAFTRQVFKELSEDAVPKVATTLANKWELERIHRLWLYF